VRVFDELRERRAVADIAGAGVEGAAERLRGVRNGRQRFERPRRADDASAFAQESKGDLAPDSSTGAGDDGDSLVDGRASVWA